MSSLLHNWECSIERNTNNTEELLKIAEDIYNTAYARGKASEERPKGKWVELPNYRHKCSICNISADALANLTEQLSNYCPNCGAKMR